MKKLILLSTTLLINLAVFSQSINYNLIIIGMDGKPMSNTEIKMIELETRKELKQTTDAQGKAAFDLTFGDTWQISIKDITDYYMWQVEMSKKGNHKTTRQIVYNMEKYERSLRPPVDRSLIKFEEVTQKITSRDRPDQEYTMYTLKIRKRNGQPLVNFPVQMTSYSQKKIYKATTNANGHAKFKLPRGQEYEIDIEGINEYTYVRLPDRPNYNGGRNMKFDPINFKEKIVNDTVIQDVDHIEAGTSARHFMTVKFGISGTGTVLKNRPVTITAMEDGTCYKATTDEEGKAKFMLPKGKHYIYRQKIMENLYNETLIKDLTRAFGVGKSHKTIFIQNVPEPPTLPKGFKIIQPNESFNWQEFFAPQNVTVSNFQNLSTPYYARNHVLFSEEEKVMDISRGFLITNGTFLNAFGPNDSPGKSSWNSSYHATNLPAGMNNSGQQVYDPCYLTIDVTPKHNQLEIEYIFASEEYPEYPNFDDAFGIYIKGDGFDEKVNQAKIPDTDKTLSVTQLIKDPDLFINNEDSSNVSFNNWQYDGFSQKYSRVFSVEPGKTYTIMLIVADAKDGIYDSGAFVGFKSYEAP